MFTEYIIYPRHIIIYNVLICESILLLNTGEKVLKCRESKHQNSINSKQNASTFIIT